MTDKQDYVSTKGSVMRQPRMDKLTASTLRQAALEDLREAERQGSKAWIATLKTRLAKLDAILDWYDYGPDEPLTVEVSQ